MLLVCLLLLQAWDQPGTGLILNERLINSPPQLAPPLVQALFSEIGWATEDEPSQVGGSTQGLHRGTAHACTELRRLRLLLLWPLWWDFVQNSVELMRPQQLQAGAGGQSRGRGA